MGLTKEQIKSLPDGTYADGEGLYLRVRNNGKYRGWIFRARVNGKQIMRGLGSTQNVTITAARAAARGIKKEQIVVNSPTFGSAWRRAVDELRDLREWANAKHAAQWYSTIETYAVPVLGDKRIEQIETEDILQVLKPIWHEKRETASRLAGRLRDIFDHWTTQKLYAKPNPAQWRGRLDHFLPGHKLDHRKHFKALKWTDVPDVVAALWAKGTTGGYATIFGIMTGLRCCEFCPARWEEFDVEAMVWTIPLSRKKTRRKDPVPHQVPLNSRIIELLDRLPHKTEYLFDAADGKTKTPHMSLSTPRKALHDLGYDVTMHGCRSTFTDWAADQDKDLLAASKQLSHKLGSDVLQAYLRTSMLPKRRPLAADWAEYCFSKVDAKSKTPS